MKTETTKRTHPRMNLAWGTALLLAALSLAPLHAATTRHVWPDSASPAPPYATWATAAHTIQDAVDAAQAGDTVLVTNGVYASGGRAVVGTMTNRVTVDKPITLLSVNGPGATVIVGAKAAGGGNGHGAIRCVHLTDGATLSGFTLTNGATRQEVGLWPLYPETGGGGVWCLSTEAVLTNCILSGNSAFSAGGGSLSGTLNDCLLIGNSAGDDGGGAYGGVLNRCVLRGNSASESGGGAHSATLNHCTLEGNSADDSGGGGAYDCTLFDCVLMGNVATYPGGGGGGARHGTLKNCVLSGNSASSGGGAAGSALYHCTLTANSASGTNEWEGGGGAWGCALHNSIAYFNTAIHGSNYMQVDYVEAALEVIQYSCVFPLPTNGVGNITNEPVFVNASAGNYRLASGSPCIDAGTNLGAIVATDLDGKPRSIDGNGDGIAAPDMGAYEFGVALQVSRVPTGNQVALSWVTSPGETYALEEKTNLSSSAWAALPSGTMNPVTVDVTAQMNYWRLWLVPSNLVWIPPGTFTMGSPTNEADRDPNEGPQTTVTISRGFYMGKSEVTQGEYLEVMGTNPSQFNGVPYPGGPDYGVDLSRPVESVLWEEATNYCAQLTQRERAAGRIAPNSVYRLPTEAEWEYACRAGTTTRFSYGDDPGRMNLSQYAWHLGNSGGTTHPVGRKLPNPWGLYDMHGNVWEWCQDWYGNYSGGTAVDPEGPATGLYRVIRSGGWGGWGEGHKDCRSAFRWRDPIDRDSNVGFRVVLVPGQP